MLKASQPEFDTMIKASTALGRTGIFACAKRAKKPRWLKISIQHHWYFFRSSTSPSSAITLGRPLVKSKENLN